MSGSLRPKLACQPCTYKKIRCDKQSPCDNCLKRGVPELCRRRGETPAATNPVASSTPLSQNGTAALGSASQDRTSALLEALLLRIKSLESLLEAQGRRANQDDHIQGNKSPPEMVNGQPYRPLVTGAMPLVHPDEHRTHQAGVEIQMPLDEGPRWSDEHGLIESEKSRLSFLQLLLPDRDQTLQIVSYHAENLLWTHNGFHAPTFDRELEDFYRTTDGDLASEGVDLQWLALLFAVLSGSMISAPEDTARSWGYQRPEQFKLADRWHTATIKCLELSQYLLASALYTVQTIVTLTASSYTLGYMKAQCVLMVSAIKIAQNLGLHQLEDTTADPEANAIQQQTSRRVWYTLVRQDYFFIPFSECYLVNRLFNDCPKPLNCREADMAPLPEEVPTLTSYCNFLDGIATLMSELQDALKVSKTLYVQYEETLRFDARMRAYATLRRPSYFGNDLLDPTWPKYIPWARRSLTISSAHKIIMIHRKFLGRSYTDPVFSFTRKTCIAAAKTILKTHNLEHDVNSDSAPILWSEQAFSVTACVILCFDILYRHVQEPEVAEHRSLVETTVSSFTKLDSYIIPRKGIRLLRALLEEGRNGNAATLDRKRRRDQDETGSLTSRASQLKPIDVDSFVKKFWISRSSSSATYNQTPQSTGSSLASLDHLNQFLDSASYTNNGMDDMLFQAFFDEDVADISTNVGLFGPASMGINIEDPATLLISSRDGPTRIPSFEDLLFRAENFEF